jgi:hypothetical protein
MLKKPAPELNTLLQNTSRRREEEEEGVTCDGENRQHTLQPNDPRQGMTAGENEKGGYTGKIPLL